MCLLKSIVWIPRGDYLLAWHEDGIFTFRYIFFCSASSSYIFSYFEDPFSSFWLVRMDTEMNLWDLNRYTDLSYFDKNYTPDKYSIHTYHLFHTVFFHYFAYYNNFLIILITENIVNRNPIFLNHNLKKTLNKSNLNTKSVVGRFYLRNTNAIIYRYVFAGLTASLGVFHPPTLFLIPPTASPCPAQVWSATFSRPSHGLGRPPTPAGAARPTLSEPLVWHYAQCIYSFENNKINNICAIDDSNHI